MNQENPSDEELSPLLEHFTERLNRVFSYFFCILEFEEDPDLQNEPSNSSRAWRLQTIHNACLDMTLLALRDLDDIFAPRSAGARFSDLRASDLGYSSSGRFLTTTERKQTNELVAHTTINGAVTRRKYWDIWEMTSKGVLQSIAMLEWIEARFGPSYFLTYTASLVSRTNTTKIHEHMAAEAFTRSKEKKRA